MKSSNPCLRYSTRVVRPKRDNGVARRWLCGLWALLVLIPASAAARWYQVEIVVFRHVDGGTATGERWPELVDLPAFNDAMKLLIDLPEMSDEPGGLFEDEPDTDSPIAFQLLELEDRTLRDVERRLQQSGEYEPLLYAAWRQPSFGIRRAKRVHLSDLDLRRPEPKTATLGQLETVALAEPDELGPVVAQVAITEGIVRLTVGRLLHVDVDFLYYYDKQPVRITEKRKIKLREVHYFDHPLFGLIVQVSPFVLPDPEPTVDED